MRRDQLRMSIKVDILPIADDNQETARLADLIEGVAGEFSPFEELHGFGIDGVDMQTSALPEGWRDRLVQNATRGSASGEPQFTGWCLDKEDLCVAKLCALRAKDQTFVAARLRADLIDERIIRTRLQSLEVRYHEPARRATAWLATWRDGQDVGLGSPAQDEVRVPGNRDRGGVIGAIDGSSRAPCGRRRVRTGRPGCRPGGG
jgi:hypothetical protein